MIAIANFAGYGGVECVNGPWDGDRRSWQGSVVQVASETAGGGQIRAGCYVSRLEGERVFYVWSADE